MYLLRREKKKEPSIQRKSETCKAVEPWPNEFQKQRIHERINSPICGRKTFKDKDKKLSQIKLLAPETKKKLRAWARVQRKVRELRCESHDTGWYRCNFEATEGTKALLHLDNVHNTGVARQNRPENGISWPSRQGKIEGRFLLTEIIERNTGRMELRNSYHVSHQPHFSLDTVENEILIPWRRYLGQKCA